MLKLLARVSIGLGLVACFLWLGMAALRPVAIPTSAVVKPDDMRPIHVSIAGHGFAIPYSYLSPRPDLTRAKAENAWDNFALAFWMPNGQPVGQDMISTPGFALDAVSFRGPVDGLYVVIVHGVFSAANEKTFPDPDVQLRNMLGTDPTLYFEKTQIDDKTTIFNSKTPGPNRFYSIYGRPGPDRKYLVHCVLSDLPHPDCHGDVRFYDYDLTARLQYPVQKDMDIAAITAKLEELLAGWAKPGN
jgi:hypothetical protein